MRPLDNLNRTVYNFYIIWRKILTNLAEILESSLGDISKNPLVEFMSINNYEVYAKSVNTVFFKCQ